MPENLPTNLGPWRLRSADQSIGWTRRERAVIMASVTATSMAFIDATALNVAIPAIQLDLSASGIEVLWIVNAYNMVIAACLLLGGVLGDRHGRRAVCVAGILVFGIASLACGLSVSAWMLILFRAVQGAGASLMIPASLAILTANIHPARRGRAIGIWSACSVVTSALGPILGGILATAGLWRCVFFINIPLAMLAVAVLQAWVPESRDSRSTRGVDLLGASVAVAALGLLNFGFIEGTAIGFFSVRVIATLLIGLSLSALFVAVESRARHPLLPLALFRNTTLTTACALTLLVYSGLYGMLLLLPMNLIEIQEYGAATAGLAQLPLMLLVVLLSRWSGGVYDRRGPKLPLVGGAVLAGIGFFALAIPGVTPGPSAYTRTFMTPLLLLGSALGILMAPLSATIMNAVHDRHAGLASGINSTLSRLSGVLGIALLGPLALLMFQSEVRGRTEFRQLDPAEQAQLLEQTGRFAQATPPITFSPERRQSLQRLLDESFVDSFRVVCNFTAVLCWIGAIVATVGIRTPPITQVTHP